MIAIAEYLTRSAGEHGHTGPRCESAAGHGGALRGRPQEPGPVVAGYGGNAHAANEFSVIEGGGKVYGMAGAENTLAAVRFNYAGKS